MTKTELTQWFEDEWWPRYLNFVKTPFKTQWGAGVKGKALTKLLQINPSEELRTTMLNSIIAQTRHRRLLYDKLGSQKAYDNYTAPLAKGGEAVYQNRQGSTYLFNRGWVDEIPALEMEESHPKTGGQCFCGQDDMGTGFCCYHTNIDEHGKYRRNQIGVTNNGKPIYRRLYLEEQIEFYKSHPNLRGKEARQYVLNYLNIIRKNDP